MNVRHIAAAVLAVGALAGTAAPASATCYVGNVDICDKPTDPYTDPVLDAARDVYTNPVFDPAWGAVGTASQAVADVYVQILCLAGLSSSC